MLKAIAVALGIGRGHCACGGTIAIAARNANGRPTMLRRLVVRLPDFGVKLATAAAL
jgi:hypothetical protein